MRWLIALLLLVGIAHAADVVVLLPDTVTGPVDHSIGYTHPTWVLWPRAVDYKQISRLLSLPSGVDWDSANLDELKGFDQAVLDHLGMRPRFAFRPDKAPMQGALTYLGGWSDGDSIPSIGMNDPWPDEALILAAPSGRNPWDEIAALSRKAGGRVVVVEFPSSPETNWTRVWLRGSGWPEGVPCLPQTRISGLVPASSLLSLLKSDSAEWTEGEQIPPDRWLGFGHEIAPVALLFLGVAVVYILGMAVYSVFREQNSRFAQWMIRLLVLGPAAILLSGRLVASTSIELWVPWLLASLIGLSIVARLVGLVGEHPLWGEFLIGSAVAAVVDPATSMFSHAIGIHPDKCSPEAFGALAAYAGGAAFLLKSRPVQRMGWSLILGVGIALAIYSATWLMPVGTWPYGILALILIQAWAGRWALGAGLAVVLGLYWSLIQPGLSYSPKGLVHRYDQIGRFNCADQVAFLLSPTFICFALVAAAVAIGANRFFGHQLRRALSFSPLPAQILYVATTFGILGAFVPIYLHAALATAIAGGVAVLFDAVRAP